MPSPETTGSISEPTAAITLSTPHEGDTVTGAFPILGTISGNTEMHGYHIGVYKTNDDLVYENQFHEHGESYTITETVTHSLTEITPLKVIIECVIDHDGETVTKTVNFVYKP